MPDELSVRQWQEKFLNGDFASKDVAVQCEAGWFDWFCQDKALAGRLKKIAPVVMRIEAPFILDNYCVCFKNSCPVSGPLYDDVRFEPLSGKRDGKYFVVTLDSPHEHVKWTLHTERSGFERPEFRSNSVTIMAEYINGIARSLERGEAAPQKTTERTTASKSAKKKEVER